MIAEYLDEAEIRRYVTAVRAKVADRSLDRLAGERVDVRYRDDGGAQTRAESF